MTLEEYNTLLKILESVVGSRLDRIVENLEEINRKLKEVNDKLTDIDLNTM